MKPSFGDLLKMLIIVCACVGAWFVMDQQIQANTQAIADIKANSISGREMGEIAERLRSIDQRLEYMNQRLNRLDYRFDEKRGQ